jgi:hypothetical protein
MGAKQPGGGKWPKAECPLRSWITGIADNQRICGMLPKPDTSPKEVQVVRPAVRAASGLSWRHSHAARLVVRGRPITKRTQAAAPTGAVA